jgi:hypothetical protein
LPPYRLLRRQRGDEAGGAGEGEGEVAEGALREAGAEGDAHGVAEERGREERRRDEGVAQRQEPEADGVETTK